MAGAAAAGGTMELTSASSWLPRIRVTDLGCSTLMENRSASTSRL